MGCTAINLPYSLAECLTTTCNLGSVLCSKAPFLCHTKLIPVMLSKSSSTVSPGQYIGSICHHLVVWTTVVLIARTQSRVLVNQPNIAYHPRHGDFHLTTKPLP